jgi:hypothetical protein
VRHGAARYSQDLMEHDDWRVTISFPDEAQAHRARALFPAREAADEVRRRLGHSVAVGGGDSRVFLYAGTEVAAREAERVARDELAQHHFRAEFAIHSWHPLEERWEDPDVALPRSESECEAEHQRLLDDETAESVRAGVAQWLVRAELPSRHEAAALAGKLRGQGRGVIRRWKFLEVGASNEDDARELAGRLRREAPAGSTVHVGHCAVYLPFAGF